MFYVDVVHYFLIFGSESWVVTPCILRALGSLHNRVARRISGRMPRCQNIQWEYPPIVKFLTDAGLGTIG